MIKSMKTTIFVLCVCLLPVCAAAQSTCETRVDAHPRATTNERVNYCLHAPADGSESNPGLVFSGVTVRHPAAGETQPAPTARDGSFEPAAVTVQQTFVQTQQFPAFTNQTLSEREIWALRQSASQTQQPQPAAAPVLSQEKPFVETLETKAGLKARRTKPGRRLWETTQEETAVVEETGVQEVSPVAGEYTYDNAGAQPYAPAAPDAQEYVPAAPDAQEYVPAEPAAQPYEPYAPAGQAEIPVGTSSYAPAN